MVLWWAILEHSLTWSLFEGKDNTEKYIVFCIFLKHEMHEKNKLFSFMLHELPGLLKFNTKVLQEKYDLYVQC